MPTTASATTPFEVVAEVRAQADTTADVAQLCIDLAAEEQNQQVLLQGWQDIVRSYDARWGERPERRVRSGHNNSSGRFSLLSEVVRFNDGSSVAFGELTADLLDLMENEYGERERANAAGRKMADVLKKELRKAKLATVAELGEERVAALQQECGYRVH